jgi:hypothetical protein
MSWIERAAALAYMPITAITEINSEYDMDELIKYLSPDLRVQGYEYINSPTRYPDVPKQFVRDSALHSSTLIERIQSTKPASTIL